MAFHFSQWYDKNCRLNIVLQRDHTSCDTHQHVLSHDYFSPALNTLHLDIGLLHKQAPDNSDWQSHLLYVSALEPPPRTVCSAHCSHWTPMTALPDIKECLLWSMRMTQPSSAKIINRNESSYQIRVNNFAEWSTEKRLLLNVNKTKELIVHQNQWSWGEAGEQF